MPDTTITLPADPRTLNCPSWCQTDHAQEWTTAVELDAEAAQMLVPGALREGAGGAE